MYKHILIPTDGSQLSAQAVRDGIRFAKAIGATVTALTVTPPFRTITVDPIILTGVPEQYERDSAEAARQALEVARAAARTSGVAADFLHLVHDQPYEAIIETATKNGCDLIFMASHGRKGVSALLLGSETAKVLTHSRIPVLVCR
jgi:nucleotide-binding universal stress UspA family protein